MAKESYSNFFNFLEKGVGRSIIKEVTATEEPFTFEVLEIALKQLHLIDEEAELAEYQDLTPWGRGGAETYIATARTAFRLFGQAFERVFLAKAVVTFPTKPELTANHWCEKLDILSKIGVNHPALYSNFNATLYQEFLPTRLVDVWPIAGELNQFNFACDLVKIYAALDASGFRPISYYFHDLMLRGNTICIVDVGQDLGDWDFEDPHNKGYQAFLGSSYFLKAEERDLKDLYEDHFWHIRGLLADLK